MIDPRLPKDVRAALVRNTMQLIDSSKFRSDMRTRFEEIDRQYMREPTPAEIAEATKAGQLDIKKLKDFRLPVVLPHVESQVAQLHHIFLQGYPVIACGASVENQATANTINALNSKHQEEFGWIRQLSRFLRNAVKYNFAAAEVKWDSYSGVVVTNTTEDKATLANYQVVGNSIKSLNVYNVFLDPHVEPADIPTKGEFAGYVERYTRVGYQQFLEKLNPKAVTDKVKSIASSRARNDYYVPEINRLANLAASMGFNWDTFIDDGASTKYANNDGTYEVLTIYRRIVPADHKIQVPAAQTVQIWKFIIVNGQHMIYAEPLSNAHGLLPVLFGQPHEDDLGVQAKSTAENLFPAQDLITQLHKARISSLRRAISDRGLFDPSKVEPRHINSDIPTAKIPVKPSAFGKPLSEAYYPIPFRDETGNLFIQEMGMIGKYADDLVGSNPVQRGSFVKGNKTQAEFETVMSNSDARGLMMASFLEAQFWSPLKRVIKFNILQYQPPQKIFDPETGGELEVNPANLRKVEFQFKMADGLIPLNKLMAMDTMTVAFQTMQAIPTLQQEGDIWSLFAYMMSSAGFPDIVKFKLTQEQKVQKLQEQLQLQQLVMAGQPPQGTPNGQ